MEGFEEASVVGGEEACETLLHHGFAAQPKKAFGARIGESHLPFDVEDDEPIWGGFQQSIKHLTVHIPLRYVARNFGEARESAG